MVRELIVVEGAHDISAVRQAVDAECIATGGHALGPDVVRAIRAAYATCGVLVLTDPDYAGDRIRARVEALVGPCKHAYVPRAECTTRTGNVGVENASVQTIRAALDAAHATLHEPQDTFVVGDLLAHGLQGGRHARERRRMLGDALDIGYANSRQLLRRLNRFGITRQAFDAAVSQVDEGSLGV